MLVTPNGSLGGTFFQLLPLLIALLGVALTAAATLLTQRLVRGWREAAELAQALDQVAAVNRQLYAEQRGIAQTLQHALLPETLPDLPGLSASSQFVPGSSGVEVGGDWYDLMALDDGSVLLVVGDVSGQGVRAATTMAALRHAVLAYAARDDQPAELLSALARFVDREQHDYFATVLCARIDVAGHRVLAASAGHLPPLVIDGESASYVALKVGVPIGAGEPSHYESTAFTVPPRATLLAYTDGLIERRGEVLDAGLERLRRAADRFALLRRLTSWSAVSSTNSQRAITTTTQRCSPCAGLTDQAACGSPPPAQRGPVGHGGPSDRSERGPAR